MLMLLFGMCTAVMSAQDVPATGNYYIKNVGISKYVNVTGAYSAEPDAADKASASVVHIGVGEADATYGDASYKLTSLSSKGIEVYDYVGHGVAVVQALAKSTLAGKVSDADLELAYDLIAQYGNGYAYMRIKPAGVPNRVFAIATIPHIPADVIAKAASYRPALNSESAIWEWAKAKALAYLDKSATDENLKKLVRHNINKVQPGHTYYLGADAYNTFDYLDAGEIADAKTFTTANVNFMWDLEAYTFVPAEADGYYRIKNAFTRTDGKQYVYVTDKFKAQPNATAIESQSLPGTVLHLKFAADTKNAGLTNVTMLRSQGVDVINGYLLPAIQKVKDELKAKIFEKLGSGLMGKLAYGLVEDNVIGKWDLNMHIAPTKTSDGREAFYAYATVPSMQPIVDFYKAFGSMAGSAFNNYPTLKAALDNGDPDAVWTVIETLAYGKIAEKFGVDNELTQLVKRYIDNERIHQGMTYYLIEGGITKVDTNSTPYDAANPTATAHNEYDPTTAKFDFANNNEDNYWGPELPAAGDGGKWILEKVDHVNYFGVKPSSSMKGRDGKYYTTLFTDFPYEVVGDVKAYTIEGVNEKDEFGRSFARVKTLGGRGTMVPARTAVVLECPSTNVKDNQLLPTGEEEVVKSDNRLCGNFFQTTIAGMKAYDGDSTEYAVTAENIRALGYNSKLSSNPIGFYKVKNTVTAVPGNKAFLVLTDTEAMSKGFYLMFDNGETTGIEELMPTDDNMSEQKIYDLQGRRVYNPRKGLYIVNGKKVIINQ